MPCRRRGTGGSRPPCCAPAAGSRRSWSSRSSSPTSAPATDARRRAGRVRRRPGRRVGRTGPAPRHTGTVSSPDDLLADAPLGAAVAALAERNRHPLEQMTEEERRDALSHWHDLAVAVLTAAGAALGGDDEPGGESQGRAVIVLEDAGE